MKLNVSMKLVENVYIITYYFDNELDNREISVNFTMRK